MTSLFNDVYNPDVLECLANLSNDEVFTPPELANKMIDLLPDELFSDPNSKFLDPACKSGVFLREIAKRLIIGLEDEIPDLQERLDHIYQNQLYGIAITELTSLMSRRTLYYTKYPQSEFSISKFDNAEGNILFRNISHTWGKEKCKFCGASKEVFDRPSELESHAYEFIHTKKPEEIFNMKFDVVIGNPPYQLQVNEAGKGLGAVPIYQKFVEQAIRLNPRYLTMIIPARWYSGGVGLTEFRNKMLTSKKVKYLVDYVNSGDCFPGVSINGGICYFLIENNYSGLCKYKSIEGSNITYSERDLNEFDIFIRRNESISIIHKVLKKSDTFLSDEGGCSPQTPFGLLSDFRGTEKKMSATDLEYLSSDGWSYVPRSKVSKSEWLIDTWKPMFSKLTCEHAGNPDKNGQYRVLSRMEILKPGQICSQSYLTMCGFKNQDEAENLFKYMRTKFVRFLIQQTLVGMNLSIKNFKFVPWLNFSKPWTDKELYEKYNLTDEEINFIETTIRSMDE